MNLFLRCHHPRKRMIQYSPGKNVARCNSNASTNPDGTLASIDAWLAEWSAAQQMTDQLSGTTTIYYFGVGGSSIAPVGQK